ncbi:MAG: DUF2797 domain-containing protein [Acidimicrobiales bacterium]
MGEWLAILGTVWAESLPFLLVKEGDAGRATLVPVAEFRFGYRARPDLARVCTGHRLEPGDQVCERRVQEGTRTCRSCAIEAALFASDLHHAHTREPTGGLTDHLNQPNVLYVAGFGDGSIKVGTSVAHRVETRLMEQGARLARIVARATDGVSIRVMEDLVTDTLAIAQTVSIRRKLRGLTEPRPGAELVEMVAGHATRVHRLLHEIEGWEQLDETWSNTVFDDVRWDRVFLYPRDLGVGTHDLVAGGACGRIVRLSRPEAGADQFVADLRQLYGVRLETGVFETPDIAAQHTLF